MVRRRGVFFELKLVDLYNMGRPSAANIREEVIDSIRLLYDVLGGQGYYASQRPEIKAICRGLKRSMIARRFPTAGHLRQHLEDVRVVGRRAADLGPLRVTRYAGRRENR